MDLSPSLLLSIVSVAIIGGSAVLVAMFATGRARGRSVATAEPRSAAVGQALAGSYMDNHAAAAVVAPVGNPIPASSPDPVASDGALEASSESSPDPSSDLTPKEPIVSDPTPPTEDGRDALTGLLDAVAFTRLIATEDARIARYHRPATVVLFELQGLDRLVERLGQEAADRVLPAVADTIRRLARGADHAARIGPARFGVLLPETDEVAAINYVERVRRACELWLESGAMAMELAIGWAGSAGDVTLVDAQRIAGDRMYAEARRFARRADPVPEPEPDAGPGSEPTIGTFTPILADDMATERPAGTDTGTSIAS